MLKIKDNVDLKELLKFGFEQKVYQKDSNIFQKIIEEEDFILTILVNDLRKRERQLSIYVYVDEDDIKNHTEDYINECYYNLDVIFDLIQAGLVEKVEGE